MTLSDSELIERLLHEDEGPALDFKRDQYPFDGEDARTKSELLKDILAFANSWRRTTAYILIGVSEVRGSRSLPVGVSDHLDDAHLQQFINSKTNRPVDFRYRQVQFDGVTLGVLEVPEQERPVYLNRSFGRLERHDVWIRRGSSSAIARPDEVARMGAVSSDANALEQPEIVVEWADLATRATFSVPYTSQSLTLEPKLPKATFAPPAPSGPFGGLTSSLTVGRPSPWYSEELIDYVASISFTKPVGIKFTNRGASAGMNVIFVGKIARAEGLMIRDYLYEPSAFTNMALSGIVNPGSSLALDVATIRLSEFSDRWELTVDIGDMRPGDQVWTSDCIFVGSSIATSVDLEAEVRAENLPEPVKCSLEIQFDHQQRAMQRDDVWPFMDDDCRNHERPCVRCLCLSSRATRASRRIAPRTAPTVHGDPALCRCAPGSSLSKEPVSLHNPPSHARKPSHGMRGSLPSRSTRRDGLGHLHLVLAKKPLRNARFDDA